MAIAGWRKPYEDQRRYAPQDIDELERHLRDEIERLTADGHSVREAFDRASKEVGDAWAGEVEYGKVYWEKVRQPSALVNEMAWGLSYLPGMLANYTIVAFRNLRRHKTISFINIAGLGIGIACCILAIAFIRYHLSWDQHHKYADRVFRVLRTIPSENRSDVNTCGPLGPALKETCPEVQEMTRVVQKHGWVMTGSGAHEMRLSVSDPSIFNVFDLPLLQGDPDKVFDRLHTVAITESAARTLFGTVDPIGRTISIESHSQTGEFVVTGLLQDPPRNSSLAPFDLLTTTRVGTTFLKSSYQVKEQTWRWDRWPSRWGSWTMMRTFIRLPSAEHAEPLREKLPTFLRQHVSAEMAAEQSYRLQPLKDIHLYGQNYGLPGEGRNLKAVYLIGGISVVILLVACINFINLSTARASLRQKEIGIRKTSGARRGDVLSQFMLESFLITSIAVVVGIALANLGTPLVRSHSGLDLPALTASDHLWLLVAALGVGVALLSGIYPSLVVSSFHPVRALKSKTYGTGGSWFQKALTACQFTACILLILSTLVMHRQTRYLMDRDMGFDQDRVITMPMFNLDRDRNPDYGKHLDTRYPTLKAEVLKHPNVVAASVFNSAPGLRPGQAKSTLVVNGERVRIGLVRCDTDYLDLFDIPIAKGRGFGEGPRGHDAPRKKDGYEVILNESAVKLLGWDDPDTGGPIGKTLEYALLRGKRTVVGVVEDFHASDLHHAVEPLGLIYVVHTLGSLGVKIKPERIDETIAFLKTFWETHLPERPFTYAFLDEEIDRRYREEMQTATLMNDFSILGILLGCMGLFGLTSFAVERKVKEVGIRKSLGATVIDIVYRLSQESGTVLLIANLIAWPLGFYLLQQWLNQFIYRIDLQVSYFALAGGAAVMVALATVALQAIPAARANPADSLRHE